MASVTDKPCICGYLEQAANDPKNPISFDRGYGAYQFVYQEPECTGPSMLVIYHCPFCGGVAPRSKPELQYHVIPAKEEERLLAMLSGLKSIDMTKEALGDPTLDEYSRQRGVEKDGLPPVFKYSRMLTYDDLSEVASVWITEREDGGIVFQLVAKQLAAER